MNPANCPQSPAEPQPSDAPKGLDRIALECRRRREEASFCLNCPRCGVGGGLQVSNNGYFASGRCWACGWRFQFKLWW